jgi:hypothetical protein
VRDALPALSRNPNFTKAWYFAELEQNGVKSGPQVDAASGLCPYADGKHELLTPTCLRDQGYTYMVFIGDSLSRELAWSFSRLASSLPGDACQQGAILHKRFENTGDGPAFACARTAPVDDSHTLCRVEDQTGQGGDISDCCSSSFKTYYYSYALPWSTGRFHTDNQTADTVNAFQDRCPCKGLLVLQYGAWIVIDAGAGMRSVDPEPWSVPFGRRRGWHDLLSRLIRPGSQLHTVIASTPHMNHHVMTLEPPKDEWERWTYQALEWMAIVDKDIAQQYNFSYAPYYEVTRQFRHISCGARMDACWSERGS